MLDLPVGASLGTEVSQAAYQPAGSVCNQGEHYGLGKFLRAVATNVDSGYVF